MFDKYIEYFWWVSLDRSDRALPLASCFAVVLRALPTSVTSSPDRVPITSESDSEEIVYRGS